MLLLEPINISEVMWLSLEGNFIGNAQAHHLKWLWKVHIWNRDHQQCSLPVVVNSGTTELASIRGTKELEKQWNFAIMWTKTIVKWMKNEITIGFVIFTCHTFPTFKFWANLIFKLWFFLNTYCIVCKVVLYPAQGTNQWFLIWPPEIVIIVDGPYWSHISQEP